MNETLSAKVRLLLRSKTALSEARIAVEECCGVRCLLETSAVVEHKAQTHFEGFALPSDLFCARYPAAHMYL